MTALWLPGIWPTTNDALDLQRADGFYQGVRKAMGYASTGTPKQSYAQYAKWGRAVARTEGIRLRQSGWVPRGMVALHFTLVAASKRPDRDAWTLAGKWATDGLVDARALPDDRDSVGLTSGRVVRREEEAVALFDRWNWQWRGLRPGLAVEILDLDEPVLCTRGVSCAHGG
jgi:hypothetical protein